MIVEIAQEAVANADDFQAKVDTAEEGRPQDGAACWLPSAEGEMRFVALSLQ